MSYSDVPGIFSFVVLALFIYWFKVLKKYCLVKSVFFLYYMFNFLIFFGPILYYRLGYEGYSNMISYKSLFIYHIIAIVVVLLNVIMSNFILKYDKKIYYNFFSRVNFVNIKNKKLVSHFYIIVFLFSILYILIYRDFFPLVKLIDQGELGERLDKNGAIPFYITMSSVFMVFVPSGFLYFRNLTNNKLLRAGLFLFTLFCLSAGGNKGLVSFFLIFYLLLVNKKQSFLKYILLLVLLTFIYLVFKGIKTFNSETVDYLIESPFRRLFAAQGSGFIARIEMMLNNDFIKGWEIKKQVYSKIYNAPLGEGTSPTHFLGDLVVRYGYFISLLIYLIYLKFFLRIFYTASKIYINDTKSSFVVWNVFLMAYITINSDISLANGIRFTLIFINFYFVYYVSRINSKI